jgi:hypothetical protein
MMKQREDYKPSRVLGQCDGGREAGPVAFMRVGVLGDSVDALMVLLWSQRGLAGILMELISMMLVGR